MLSNLPIYYNENKEHIYNNLFLSSGLACCYIVADFLFELIVIGAALTDFIILFALLLFVDIGLIYTIVSPRNTPSIGETKETIHHTTLKAAITLLFILSFATPFSLGLFPAYLMFWQLVTDKENYSEQELAICLLISVAPSLSLSFWLIPMLLGTNGLLLSLFQLALSCILPIITAYNYHDGNINIANIFCIKKPEPNQLSKILLQFIGYSIPILVLFYYTNTLSFLLQITLKNAPTAIPLFALLIFQTYWEEAIFRLFLIKSCVDKDNIIDSYKATALSLVSSLLFAYAHRYNGAFRAIQKTTTFIKAMIICFLEYSGNYLILSISNIKKGNIVPTWVLHYYHNVVAFSLGFIKKEYDQFMDAPKPTIGNTLLDASCSALFIASMGKLTLNAMNKIGINTNIKYAKSNKPSSGFENKAYGEEENIKASRVKKTAG